VAPCDLPAGELRLDSGEDTANGGKGTVNGEGSTSGDDAAARNVLRPCKVLRPGPGVLEQQWAALLHKWDAVWPWELPVPKIFNSMSKTEG